MATYLISKFTMPDGNVMELKDKVARQAVLGGTFFLGVTETPIEDESAQTIVVIDGQEVEVRNGSIVVVGVKEFIYSEKDHKWHEFGDVTNLGALALKNEAAGMYTPGGTISQPVFTGTDISYTPSGNISKPDISVTPTMYNVKEIVTEGSVVSGTAASATMSAMEFDYDAESQHLTLNWSAGSFTPNVPTTVTMPTVQQVSVVSGITAQLASTPIFTGTSIRLPVEGSVSQPIFTGTRATIVVE